MSQGSKMTCLLAVNYLQASFQETKRGSRTQGDDETKAMALRKSNTEWQDRSPTTPSNSLHQHQLCGMDNAASTTPPQNSLTRDILQIPPQLCLIITLSTLNQF